MERVVSREDAEKALKGMIAIMDSLDLAGCLLDNELEQFYNFNSIINDYIKGGIKESYASSEELSKI